MATYTTKQICDRYGFSRQFLHQMRSGKRPPLLKENEHWHWEKGNIVFTELTVGILDEKYKKRSQAL